MKRNKSKTLKAPKRKPAKRGLGAKSKSLKAPKRKPARIRTLPARFDRIKRVIETYGIMVDKIPARVSIISDPKEFVYIYAVKLPKVEPGTKAVLESIKKELAREIVIKPTEALDIKSEILLKKKFAKKIKELLKTELPRVSEGKADILTGFLLHEVIGIGTIEILLGDDNLEEVVINNVLEPVWVYHKKHGWLKTNVVLDDETQIYHYSRFIGRKVGRTITNLNPLMDAHLITGDRVNATLFPISTKGNTITIRKFRRKPWTITDFIFNKTFNPEIVALLWLSFQYEISTLFSGGTASGKTSMLGCCLPFIPSNHRIISIEDTREIMLADFQHWIPMVTRAPNPEGEGEISMLDLLVNSLRMRPDRLIVGEIRRQREAEVLFEALHTGHSVYATLHADTADQTIKRMITPPINLPATMIEALPLIIVLFRHRRLGIRRVFEVAEVIHPKSDNEKLRANILYRWNPRSDKIEKIGKSVRLINDLLMHAGMSRNEVLKDLAEKEKILEWVCENKINTVNTVGKVISSYYSDPKFVLKVVNEKEKPKALLGDLVKELEE